jgi:hypothetical protein
MPTTEQERKQLYDAVEEASCMEDVMLGIDIFSRSRCPTDEEKANAFATEWKNAAMFQMRSRYLHMTEMAGHVLVHPPYDGSDLWWQGCPSCLSQYMNFNGNWLISTIMREMVTKYDTE